VAIKVEAQRRKECDKKAESKLEDNEKWLLNKITINIKTFYLLTKILYLFIY